MILYIFGVWSFMGNGIESGVWCEFGVMRWEMSMNIAWGWSGWGDMGVSNVLGIHGFCMIMKDIWEKGLIDDWIFGGSGVLIL